MAKKRERLEVIHDILASVRDHRRIGPTRLLYASNLSPQMFREYVSELLDKRFMTEEDGQKKAYVLTDKGYRFLQEYGTITRFIDSFGL